MKYLRFAVGFLGATAPFAWAVGACSATRQVDSAQGAQGGGGAQTSVSSSATGGASTGTATGGGGSAPYTCDPMAPDLTNCPCGAPGDTRACYPATANPQTRNVGTCKDGTQMCHVDKEFYSWGSCTGAVTPSAETCTDGLDHDCNGKTGCMDPSCATNPACGGACTTGDTRPCYDGPPGSEGVGTCKPGTQTCTNGAWPTVCTGEVLPQNEVCSDLADHNCNGLPGCFDFIVCFTDPACQPPPCMPMGDCTCPTGDGDNASCPDGDYGDPYTGLCCPCTSSTCDEVGCCGETACAGAAACNGLVCGPLPASCNGMVNADCDWEDLATADPSNPPEDCDMPCCKCRPTLCP